MTDDRQSAIASVVAGCDVSEVTRARTGDIIRDFTRVAGHRRP